MRGPRLPRTRRTELDDRGLVSQLAADCRAIAAEEIVGRQVRGRSHLAFESGVRRASRSTPSFAATRITLRSAILPNATAYHLRMPDAARRNPNWAWDEIILACDLVMRNGRRALDAGNPEVVELSELLQRMTLHPLKTRLADFRNPNGVRRKTADIATAIPGYSGTPTHGSQLDKDVIDRFIAEPDVMRSLAESIRNRIAEGEPPDFPTETGYENESEMEGRYLLRWHAYRERNPTLRRKKINSVLRRGDRLACEVCTFDFAQTYGERGRGYIECHHVERCTSSVKPQEASTISPCSAPTATA
jgi:predicted HNH restriction endonuclease